MAREKFLILERAPKRHPETESIDLITAFAEFCESKGYRLRFTDSLNLTDMRMADFVFEIQKERQSISHALADLFIRTGDSDFMTDVVSRIQEESNRASANPALQKRNPCLDPDKMHGAADGFPGCDFP